MIAASLLLPAVAVAADAGKPITYDDHVAAILKRHCFQCHGEAKQKAGLDLSSYASLLKGSTGGAVVVSGRSGASRLVELITADDDAERMPPDNDPIPGEEVATIRAWIDSGLRQNAGAEASAASTVAFTPTTPSGRDGPPPMPEKWPAIERAETIRPFPVLALAASPRAPIAAVGSYECIDLIDPATRRVLGSLPFPTGEPHVLRFSRSGAVLLAAGGRPVQAGSAVFYDMRSGKRLAELGNEADVVLAADIAGDERRVAIGGPNRLVKVFSTETGKPLYTLAKHTDWITAIAFSPDGKQLATGDRIGNIHLWDAIGGGVLLPLSEHKGAVRALAWRSDGRVLASCGEDGLIVWWDVAKGWPSISKADAHPPARPAGYFGKLANGVLDASFGPGGELVTCGRDRAVRLWAEDGRALKAIPLDGEAPTATARVRVVPTRVAIAADGAVILAGDSAGRLHAWPADATTKSK